MTEPKGAPEPLDDIAMLDGLIRKYYQQFRNSKEDKIKIGELLKMIELRRKLSPADDAQKKFWKMLNKVRKETLDEPAEKTGRQDKPEKK